MAYIKLEPQFVEELVFKMDPEHVDAYIRADEQSWGALLSSVPGYLGGEIWESISEPGVVHNIIYWDKIESLESVSKELCAQADAKLNELLGGVKVDFVEVRHASHPMRRIYAVEPPQK